MKNTSQELVRKFEVFFIRLYPKVKGFALTLLQNEDEAADVAQDIFIKIWAEPEIWQNDDFKDSYVFTMTKNHVLNLIRRKNVERKYQERVIQRNNNVSEHITEIEKKIYSEELELLYKLNVDKMPPQRKLIFKLSRFEGKTNQEIAEKLNLSIRTIERHIHLALQDLKEIPLFLFFLLF